MNDILKSQEGIPRVIEDNQIEGITQGVTTGETNKLIFSFILFKSLS